LQEGYRTAEFVERSYISVGPLDGDFGQDLTDFGPKIGRARGRAARRSHGIIVIATRIIVVCRVVVVCRIIVITSAAPRGKACGEREREK
jgi:hypothetical protein